MAKQSKKDLLAEMGSRFFAEQEMVEKENEVKTEQEAAPVAASAPERASEIEMTAELPVASAPTGKKRGRPRKDTVAQNDKGTIDRVRCAVSPEMKKKLKLICIEKHISEDDFAREALYKAIEKQYNAIFGGN